MTAAMRTAPGATAPGTFAFWALANTPRCRRPDRRLENGGRICPGEKTLSPASPMPAPSAHLARARSIRPACVGPPRPCPLHPSRVRRPASPMPVPSAPRAHPPASPVPAPSTPRASGRRSPGKPPRRSLAFFRLCLFATLVKDRGISHHPPSYPPVWRRFTEHAFCLYHMLYEGRAPAQRGKNFLFTYSFPVLQLP